MPKPSPIEPEETVEAKTLTIFTCARCGFQYQKVFDFEPYLCYRCMRYVAKRVYTTMYTIQPPTSRPERDEV